MSRATPLPPEERRQAIIDATRPLLLEHGHGLSTRQIAEACGIAEGTVFRVFDSKQELFRAVIEDAMRVEGLLASIGRAQGPDLAGVAVRIVGVLQDHAREARLLMALAQHLDPAREKRGAHGHDHAGGVIEAIVDALAPHEAELSVPTRAAAGALMALSFGSSFTVAEGVRPPAPDAVANILLNGIREASC